MNILTNNNVVSSYELEQRMKRLERLDDNGDADRDEERELKALRGLSRWAREHTDYDYTLIDKNCLATVVEERARADHYDITVMGEDILDAVDWHELASSIDSDMAECETDEFGTWLLEEE
jgi:hypothetical protein